VLPLLVYILVPGTLVRPIPDTTGFAFEDSSYYKETLAKFLIFCKSHDGTTYTLFHFIFRYIESQDLFTMDMTCIIFTGFVPIDQSQIDSHVLEWPIYV